MALDFDLKVIKVIIELYILYITNSRWYSFRIKPYKGQKVLLTIKPIQLICPSFTHVLYNTGISLFLSHCCILSLSFWNKTCEFCAHTLLRADISACFNSYVVICTWTHQISMSMNCRSNMRSMSLGRGFWDGDKMLNVSFSVSKPDLENTPYITWIL